jgi:dTMP kinase
MKPHIGYLVALEGIDRAGKSSMLKMMPSILSDCVVKVVTCGERLSPLGDLLASKELPRLSPFIKTFWFAADRAWVFEKVCQPELRIGALVIWDRYVASAIAYRSADFSDGTDLIDTEFVERINSRFPIPDLTILLDISTRTSSDRARHAGQEESYSMIHLERVREAYLTLARRWPTVTVNGEQLPDGVAADIGAAIRKRFPELFHGT